MRYKTPLAQRKAVRRHQRKINSDPDKRYQRTKQTYASHARTFARKYATHAGEIDAFVSELLAIKKSRFGTASTTDDNGRISSKSTAVDGDQIHELTQAWITNTAANAAEINHLLRDLNRFKIERFGDDHQRLMDEQNQPAPVPATPKRPDWRNPYERQQLINELVTHAKDVHDVNQFIDALNQTKKINYGDDHLVLINQERLKAQNEPTAMFNWAKYEAPLNELKHAINYLHQIVETRENQPR